MGALIDAPKNNHMSACCHCPNYQSIYMKRKNGVINSNSISLLPILRCSETLLSESTRLRQTNC